MPRKSISTDELARMIQEDVVAHMATKDDIAQLNVRLERVEGSLARIETGQGNRISKLEDDMRLVKTKLGIA